MSTTRWCRRPHRRSRSHTALQAQARPCAAPPEPDGPRMANPDAPPAPPAPALPWAYALGDCVGYQSHESRTVDPSRVVGRTWTQAVDLLDTQQSRLMPWTLSGVWTRDRPRVVFAADVVPWPREEAP